MAFKKIGRHTQAPPPSFCKQLTYQAVDSGLYWTRPLCGTNRRTAVKSQVEGRHGKDLSLYTYLFANPTPHTPHPALYTPHPAPFTLHPALHTLHPALYTLHPAPFTLHPAAYTSHPTPHTVHPTRYMTHGTQYTLHATPQPN